MHVHACGALAIAAPEGPPAVMVEHVITRGTHAHPQSGDGMSLVHRLLVCSGLAAPPPPRLAYRSGCSATQHAPPGGTVMEQQRPAAGAARAVTPGTWIYSDACSRWRWR